MSFRNHAHLWEHTPALRVLVPLVAGIAFYDSVLEGNGINITLLLSLSAILIAAIAILNIFKIQQITSAVLLQVLFVCSGIALCYSGDDRHRADWIGLHTDSSFRLIGVVSEQPQEKSRTIKMPVKALAISGTKGSIPVSGNAWVYLYKSGNLQSLNKGDTIAVPNAWQKIRNSTQFSGMDYAQYCRRKNIHLQQFTDQVAVYGRQDPANIPITDRIREHSLSIIDRFIADSTTAALLDAMVLGEESHIDPDTRQIYSDTGIIHIVSISGAHIAILFFLISYVFSRLTRKENHWIRYGFTIILIWFYISIAGMPIPAIRAATMFTVLAAGNMLGRQHNPLNQLCVSAVIMLLIQPMWLFGIGFQLSFLAVLSMILFYKPILSFWPVQNPVLSFFTQTIAASLAAEILVAPLVAYYFHSFPLMFIFANLIAGLVMSLILCLGLLLLLLNQIVLLAKALALLIVILSHSFHWAIGILDRVDITFFKTIVITPIFLLLVYLLILAACTIRHNRNAIWLGLGCLLCLSIMSWARAVQVGTQRRLIVFQDKGKAYMELLEGRHYHALNNIASASTTAKLAHINFGTEEAGPPVRNKVLILKGKKIVCVDSTSVAPPNFTADILVVSAALPDKEAVLDACSPKLVVLAYPGKSQSDAWEKICSERRVALHSVREQGSFIFP